MINDAFRNTTKKLSAAVFLAASALLTASCGGGGAAGNPTVGGDLSIIPNPGTAYAGVPFTVTIAGGRKPYAVGSSEPSIFPVPAIANESIFQVLPGNPGVVDTGLQPGEVPRRAVILNARDVNGFTASATLSVLQNFLLGYGVSYQNACPAPTSGSPPQACNGTESLVTLAPTFNGLLFGNKVLRFERLRGSFGFTQCGSPPPVDPAIVTTITTNTSHDGVAHVCLRPSANSATQIASYRVIEVNTGVYVDEFFFIVGGAPSGQLTVTPPSLAFTSSISGRCGTGSGDVLVFDGVAPYTAVSSSPSVTVNPTSSNSQPGRFSITQNNQTAPCQDASVIISDAEGRRATVPVTQSAGPAPTPLSVQPTSVTLDCGQSSSLVVLGGTGTISAASASPGVVTATVAGNSVTVTRTGTLPAVVPAPIPVVVTVTDGTTAVPVTVTVPTTCT